MFKSFLVFMLLVLVFILVFPNAAIKIIYVINAMFRDIVSMFSKEDKHELSNCSNKLDANTVYNTQKEPNLSLWLGCLFGGGLTLFAIVFAGSFIIGLLPVFGWLVPISLFFIILMFKPSDK